MSKIVSKKILSLIIFFVIVLILLFTGYKILSDGVYVQNLKLGKLNVSQLYLKLDNKLILDIGKLDLSSYLKGDSKPLDIEVFTENIKYGIWAISYFQKLEIKEIILNADKKGSVIYNGTQYKIDFPNILANFAIQNNDKDIHLKILSLLLKDMGIESDGNIIYSTQTRKLGFNLIINPVVSKDNILYLQGITNLKTLQLNAKTSEIKDIAFLKPYFEEIPDQALQEWIFQKIKFSSFQINTAKIQATLTKGNFLPSLMKNADMKITIKDPQIYLEDGLEPINAKQTDLKIKDEKIYIQLQSPIYDDVDLEGSSLTLSNLLESPKLDIHIISKKAYYGQALKDLLKDYHINLPIDNLNSPVDTDLNLSIQFLQNSDPILSAKGLIQTQESDFLLYDIPLYSQNTNVSLEITPEYKYVYINATHARYQNMADLDTKITLDLKDDNLSADTTIHKLQVNTNNDINTLPFQEPLTPSEQQDQKEVQHNPEVTQNNPNLPTQDYQKPSSQPYQLSPAALLKRKIIDAIKAQSKEKFTKDIFYADAQSLPNLSFSIDFSNPQSILLNIPEFQVEGTIADNLYELKIKDLSKFYPYSPLLQYLMIKNGDISISTNDFENIDFETYLSDLNIPLYQKNGKKLNEISISGKISKDAINASSSEKNFSLAIKGNQKNIIFKNLDFNLDEFLKSDIPAIKEMLEKSPQTKLTQKQIEEETRFIREKQKYEYLHNIDPFITSIQSDNIAITYKNYQIPLDDINLRLRDNRIAADGTYKNGIVNLDIIHGDIFVKANNFSGDFINKVLKKNIVSGGLYTLIGGYKDEVFNGELKLQNTLFRDFALLQNIINLIDTIPSLIVFKNPNLGTDGYEIQKGSIIFGINSKYIGFEHINLIGRSMDVDGNGVIELDSDEMNMNLTISTIKNFSNIINKIPIVGYLILGNEGKISTHVIVNGTLEDPKTKITLAEDTIKAPFNILRRVFTPIDIIVDEIKNEMKKD